MLNLKKALTFMVYVVICIAVFLPAVGFSSATLSEKQLPKIAVVIKADSSIQSSEKIVPILREQLLKRFPSNQYLLIENDKIYQDFLIMVEENKIYNYADTPKQVLVSLGKKHSADYLLFLNLTLASTDYESGFWSSAYKIIINMRAKVVDVSKDQYVYNQEIAGSGKSSDMLGTPSSLTALTRAANKCIEQFCSTININP